jgi:hypothetical protein
MLGAFFVPTPWHVVRLWMEGKASRMHKAWMDAKDA